MDSSRYLKLNPEEAYEMRKDLQFSEEKFNNIQRQIRAYKFLRKKEVILKNKLKIAFTSLKGKISLMESTFPEEERKKAQDQIFQNKKQQQKKDFFPINTSFKPHFPIMEPRKSHSEDLDDIKRKLQRLGM